MPVCSAASTSPITVIADSSRSICRRSSEASRSFTCCSLSAADATADLHRAESGLTPADDEDAEALLHARFNVRFAGRIAARHVELLACGENLLDRGLPFHLVDHAPTRRV